MASTRWLEDRARAGFPSSPQEPLDRLVTFFGLDGCYRSGWVTRGLAGDLAEATALVETQEWVRRRRAELDS